MSVLLKSSLPSFDFKCNNQSNITKTTYKLCFTWGRSKICDCGPLIGQPALQFHCACQRERVCIQVQWVHGSYDIFSFAPEAGITRA